MYSQARVRFVANRCVDHFSKFKFSAKVYKRPRAPSSGCTQKHVLASRTTSISSQNSNFPPRSINDHARHLAAALPSTSNANRFLRSATRNQKSTTRHLAAAFTSTRFPSDLLIVHVSRFSKFKFFSQIPMHAILRLHSQSISSSLLKIQIYRQNINTRHLAVALATSFTLNLCHFSNFPPKSMYHCAPSSVNVKNPKPEIHITDRRLAGTQTTYLMSVR